MLEAERKIQTLAMSDLLTGLANRHSLRQALHAAIVRAKRHQTKLAILMIDLDRFKPINDRHGHLIGDLVLKAVAERMANALGQGRDFAHALAAMNSWQPSNIRTTTSPALDRPAPDRGTVGADDLRQPDGPDRRERRHRHLSGRRGSGGGADPQGRHRALPRQAGRARLGAILRCHDAHDTDARAKLEDELRARDRDRRHRSLLPAAHRSQKRRAQRFRSVEPLAAPDARLDAAQPTSFRSPNPRG